MMFDAAAAQRQSETERRSSLGRSIQRIKNVLLSGRPKFVGGLLDGCPRPRRILKGSQNIESSVTATV